MAGAAGDMAAGLTFGVVVACPLGVALLLGVALALPFGVVFALLLGVAGCMALCGAMTSYQTEYDKRS